MRVSIFLGQLAFQDKQVHPLGEAGQARVETGVSGIAKTRRRRLPAESDRLRRMRHLARKHLPSRAFYDFLVFELPHIDLITLRLEPGIMSPLEPGKEF